MGEVVEGCDIALDCRDASYGFTVVGAEVAARDDLGEDLDQQ